MGNLGLIPGLGRSPGGGHGNPLQCSCLENPQGQRSLAGCSLWGRKESDTTERLSTAHSDRKGIGDYQGGRDYKTQWKFLKVIDIFTILIVVMISWVCTHVKIVHFKHMQFIINSKICMLCCAQGRSETMEDFHQNLSFWESVIQRLLIKMSKLTWFLMWKFPPS